MSYRRNARRRAIYRINQLRHIGKADPRPPRADTLPSAREWYGYLREERRNNPGFRNIINSKGELV